MKRVCLLTGASGLLGTAFIERCHPIYDIIAVHNRNPVQFATQHQKFVDPLAPSRLVAANEHATHSIQADICDLDAINRVVGEVQAHFGNIDLLINAAAIRAWSPVLSATSLDAAEMVLKINVLGPIRLSVAIARALWKSGCTENQRRNRNIVNISSSAGLFVYPDQGQTLYGMSKAALNHSTYHLAIEFWDIGIRVNALAPDTFPGRVSTAKVVDTIIDLDASEQTGQIISLLGP
jgi:NAD(P)-dependent dehydrogenase (short-subunit alcohol dehydrogenase family)